MLYLNDCKEITGFEAEDFLSGRINFTQLYHPEDRQHIFNEVDKALEKGKKFHLRYRILNQSGEWRWVEDVGIGVYTDTLDLIADSSVTSLHRSKRKANSRKLQKKITGCLIMQLPLTPSPDLTIISTTKSNLTLLLAD
jgi:PAS domain-containing protein